MNSENELSIRKQLPSLLGNKNTDFKEKLSLLIKQSRWYRFHRVRR